MHSGTGGGGITLTASVSGYTYVDRDGFAGKSGGTSVSFGGGGGGIGGAATGSSGVGGIGTSFVKAGYSYTNVGRGGYSGGATKPTQNSFGSGGHGASFSTSYANDGNNGAITFEYPSSVGYTQIRCYSSTVYTHVSGNNRQYVVYPTPGNVGVPKLNNSYTIEKEIVKMAWDKDADSLPIWNTTSDNYQTISSTLRTDPLSANLLAGFTNHEIPTNYAQMSELANSSNYAGGFFRDATGAAPATSTGAAVAPYYGSLGEHNGETSIYLNAGAPELEIDGTNTFTIEGWFKLDSFPSASDKDENIITYGTEVGGTNSTGWGVRVTGDYDTSNGHVMFILGGNTETDYHYRQDEWYGTVTGLDPEPIKSNTWFHLCIEVDGLTITVYVNGIEQGSTTLVGAAQHSGLDSFVIFGSVNGMGGNERPSFIGQVLDFRIYDTIKYGAEFFVPIGHALPI